MTPAERMEEAVREHPGIGRGKLAEIAGVGEKTARKFLQRKRDFQDVCKQTLVVALHDWHVPYHDPAALACAFTFCEQVQPQYIILHECHDFYALSRFSKDPARKHELQYEIDLVGEYLRDLRKRCPHSKMVLLKANHTDRLQRYLWNEAPALSSLRSLRIEEILKLGELEIEYKPHFEHKGFLWKHGSIVRQDSAYTAKAELLREGMSGASGHTHRLGSHYRTLRGGSYVWVEGGCLCDLHPEYLDENIANWQHGISVVNFEANGSQYFARPIPIIAGKMLWGDKLITA